MVDGVGPAISWPSTIKDLLSYIELLEIEKSENERIGEIAINIYNSLDSDNIEKKILKMILKEIIEEANVRK